MNLPFTTRMVLALLSVAAAGSSAPALGSTTWCTSSALLGSDCAVWPGDRAWPADQRPTFSLVCQGCGFSGGYSDAGALAGKCSTITWDPTSLWMMVGNQRYGGEHFERVGSCQGDPLYRYKGPLAPGLAHQVHTWNTYLPGKTGLVLFTVAPVDAGAGEDVRRDDNAPPSDGGRTGADAGAPRRPTPASSGCALAGNAGADFSWLAGWTYLILGWWREARQSHAAS